MALESTVGFASSRGDAEDKRADSTTLGWLAEPAEDILISFYVCLVRQHRGKKQRRGHGMHFSEEQLRVLSCVWTCNKLDLLLMSHPDAGPSRQSLVLSETFLLQTHRS